ncbi:MAG: DUF4177 domain-containing protein [Deltaproteobacteria bacterium]|nr:DUF4177 domain-containing protein [Deltaproteobacteria bacterium]
MAAAWEYKVVVLPASKYDVDAEILNLHGEKGWELVTVLLDASNHRACYFKRGADVVPEETEPGLG